MIRIPSKITENVADSDSTQTDVELVTIIRESMIQERWSTCILAKYICMMETLPGVERTTSGEFEWSETMFTTYTNLHPSICNRIKFQRFLSLVRIIADIRFSPALSYCGHLQVRILLLCIG